MKTFYTGSDIEDLAASGVKQLVLGPGISITDVARELAAEYGIELVAPGAAAPQQPVARAAVPTAAASALPARPSGCQHGPLPASDGRGSASGGTGRSDGVVGRLVNLVSRLADQGG
jgi:hypothetical protein